MEKDTINYSTKFPHTVKSLIKDFKHIGIEKGMTLIVHSSLSSIGWVCGGAVSVILALEEVLTSSGTLVMPTHSSDLSDPGKWSNPPVPESWWGTIRNEMPAYDKNLTPTRGMGIIPEVFRKQKGVARSNHPNTSFAAWGRKKNYIIQDNKLDYQMDMKSPLGRIYEIDGYILLLGVGYDRNTSFHLAEYLANFKKKTEVLEYSSITENGKRIWKGYKDISLYNDDFGSIGDDYEKEHIVSTGKIGNSETKLISQREIVDYAVQWMGNNRDL